MDPPKHDVQRKTVSPAVAPSNLAAMAPVIRARAGEILDSLPIGVELDWVDLVSKELTAMTLATLFDFPQEDRRLLTHWSDMFTNAPGHGPAKSYGSTSASRPTPVSAASPRCGTSGSTRRPPATSSR